jgi:hypothetical protein
MNRKPHRPFCHICNAVVRVDFWVPDEIWKLALHESHQRAYICLECFTRNADERGVEWDSKIKFFPTSQITDTNLKAQAANNGR